MRVIDLKSKLSVGVQREIEVNDDGHGEKVIAARLKNAECARDYYASLIETIYGQEIVRHVARLAGDRPLKILDIGFGLGESSLYLADQGHYVCAIEPSPRNCHALQQAAEKFALPLDVFQGVGEDCDRIPNSDFDLCLFNSSLHHCDDPVKALYNCRLKCKGKVLAINEPLLKFYRSKKWYFHQLEHNPIAMGHYGGNEHIYTFREYQQLFLEAGFTVVKSYFHGRNFNPRATIRADMDKVIEEKAVYSDKKLILKFFLLSLLKPICRNESGVLSRLLKRLSLVPLTFEGS